jgi:hypothetical protein
VGNNPLLPVASTSIRGPDVAQDVAQDGAQDVGCHPRYDLLVKWSLCFSLEVKMSNSDKAL